MSTDNIKTTDKKDFLHVLFKHCTEKATGTFFLVTDQNRAIQFTLKQGKLIGYSHGHEKGLSALAAFKNIVIQKHSFSTDLILPLETNATIDNSSEAMKILGFTAYQHETSKNTVKQESEATIIKSERRKEDRRITGMYRGQPIYAKEDEESTPNVERRKGERRMTGMYRGQPVYAND